MGPAAAYDTHSCLIALTCVSSQSPVYIYTRLVIVSKSASISARCNCVNLYVRNWILGTIYKFWNITPKSQSCQCWAEVTEGNWFFSMTIKNVHKYPPLILFCFESKVNHLVQILLKCYLIFFCAFSLLHVHCNTILGCILISIG